MCVDTRHISTVEAIGRVSGCGSGRAPHRGLRALSHLCANWVEVEIRMAAPLCFVPESARPRLTQCPGMGSVSRFMARS